MKKLLLTLIIMITFIAQTQAQKSPKFSFRDAVAIDSNFKEKKYSEVMKILTQYYMLQNNVNSVPYKVLKEYFYNNEFIRPFIDTIDIYRKTILDNLRNTNKRRLQQNRILTFQIKTLSKVISNSPKPVNISRPYLTRTKNSLQNIIKINCDSIENNIKTIEIIESEEHKKEDAIKLTLNQNYTANSRLSESEETTPNQTIIQVNAERSGSFQSNLLDGTAQFIAERMKEEINIAFFDKFQNILEKTNFGILFPQTQEIIVGTSSFNYSITVQVLKEAFEKDLDNILQNLPEFIEKTKLVRNKEVLSYLVLSSKVVSKIDEGVSPTAFLSFIKKEFEKDKKNNNFKAKAYKVFATAEIFAYSLRGLDNQESYWISPKDFDRLTQERRLSNIYLALVYEQLKSLDDKLLVNQKWIAELNRFYGLFTKIEGNVKYIKEKLAEGKKVSAEEYLAISNQTIGLIENTFNLSIVPDNFWGEAENTLTEIRTLQKLLQDLYADIQSRDYGSISTNLISLLSKLKVFNYQTNIKMRLILEDLKTLLKSFIDIKNDLREIKSNPSNSINVANLKIRLGGIKEILKNLNSNILNDTQLGKLNSFINILLYDNVLNWNENFDKLDELIILLSTQISKTSNNTRQILSIIELISDWDSCNNICIKNKIISLFEVIYPIILMEENPNFDVSLIDEFYKMPDLNSDAIINTLIITFTQKDINRKKDEKKYTILINLLNFIKNTDYNDKSKTLAFAKELSIYFLEKIPDENNSFNKEEIIKYISFIVAIIDAKDSKEIKEAIKSIALPAGSYSIKRKARCNISLNAYAGITVGAEYKLKDGRIDGFYKQNWAGNLGFTAPVGIGFNWGSGKDVAVDRFEEYSSIKRNAKGRYRGLRGESLSLFVSVIDLGALVLFRLGDTESPLPEDVSFEQVFAPGAFFVWGLRNSPISLFAGTQYSPRLRTITENAIETRANALRFNVGLTIDIPILNFYTRTTPRKKR